MLKNKYYPLIKKAKSDPNAITIYLLSDIHILNSVDGNPSDPNSSIGNRLFYTASQKLQNYVDIVNTESPDLAFCLGDMLEYWGDEGTPELFQSKWDQINTPKGLVIGNHDLAFGGLAVVNTDMAEIFGYGDKSLIAGSKYNYSFYINKGDNSIKVITVDTNIDNDGLHFVGTVQKINLELRSWIEQEIINSTTNNIMIFSHASPFDNEYHFDIIDGTNFKNMITSITTQNPSKKIYMFSGHNHSSSLEEYNTDINGVKAYKIPPVVDFEVGQYVKVIFSEINGIKLIGSTLRYPYP